MIIDDNKSQILIALAFNAGQEIVRIYNKKVTKKLKSDNSPVTNADLKANAIICEGLKKYFPKVPIVSEELDNSQIKNKKIFWLVDPLDGTKEFLKGNGEFTVNISLIMNKKPIYGLIYMPTKNKFYYTKNKKSYFAKFDQKGKLKNIKVIKVKKRKKNILVLSRSHGLSKEKLRKAKKAVFKKFNANKIIRSGSSIKLCYIADGTANIYLRYGRTMEWDIAAGDAILRYAGGRIKTLDRKIMKYGKPGFENSSFIAKS
jgi:3'(2'), 5'-bisphosphate nucleotidase